MAIRAISHVAVGVRDMDRALRFYRDALGLRVKLDTIEELPGLRRIGAAQAPRGLSRVERGAARVFRRARSAARHGSVGEPARLFQTGIHHFSFWVDDIHAIVARARAAGLDVLFDPGVGDTLAYGEAPGGKVLSTFLRDPDGNYVQLDQRA